MSRRANSLASIFGELRNDFRAGKDTRFASRLTGVSSSGSGADYHYRSEQQWLHMLERARHYHRNDAVVGQGVRRLVANVVQEGFTLDVSTGDKGLDSELKNRWTTWSENPDLCHSEGEYTWSQIEQLGLVSTIVDGDIFALPLRTGELQLVEAHRVRTPRSTKRNVVHGVLMDNRARRQEYWITKEDLDPSRAVAKVSDIKAYPARDAHGERLVNHLYMPQRASQRRGVTAIAPISDAVGMHDDIQFATLVKAQMAALIAILHERGPDWVPSGDQQKGPRTTDDQGGYTRTIEGLNAGLEIFSDRDEKLSAFSAQIPSPEFFPHATMILTFIAVNLDLPVAVLMLDPSNTNFSGWRGAIDQARMRFKQIQKWYSNALHSRTYQWKVRQWMEDDAAINAASGRSGVEIFGHRWNLPAFAYIEPKKDAEADLIQMDNNLNSPRRIQASRGREYDEVISEVIADNKLAISSAMEAAEDLMHEYPKHGVDWRELLNPRSGSRGAVTPEEADELDEIQPPKSSRLNGHTRNGHA